MILSNLDADWLMFEHTPPTCCHIWETRDLLASLLTTTLLNHTARSIRVVSGNFRSRSCWQYEQFSGVKLWGMVSSTTFIPSTVFYVISLPANCKHVVSSCLSIEGTYAIYHGFIQMQWIYEWYSQGFNFI